MGPGRPEVLARSSRAATASSSSSPVAPTRVLSTARAYAAVCSRPGTMTSAKLRSRRAIGVTRMSTPAGPSGACAGARQQWANMAQTTFPASSGAVYPHSSLRARMMCRPRPVSAKVAGARVTGTAWLGSATAQSTHGPRW